MPGGRFFGASFEHVARGTTPTRLRLNCVLAVQRFPTSMRDLAAVPRKRANYLLPRRVANRSLERALAPSFAVQLDGEHEQRRTFYDTFDRRLRRAGMSLVHERRRLTLVDENGTERAAADMPRARKRLFARDLQGGLRELLVGVAKVRAMTPVAQVQSRRRIGEVVDEQEKAVAQLELEEPKLPQANNARLRPRLYARRMPGSGKAFSRLCGLLEEELGLGAAEVPLVEEAMARADGAQSSVPTKPALRIDPREPAAAVAARVSRALLEVIEVNMEGAIADTDPEFLHDLRVAVRRTRSVQRELQKVFAPDVLERFRTDFRWLQGVTGPVRDLDVQLLELESLRTSLGEGEATSLEPLREVLAGRRQRERRRMVRALRSERTAGLLTGWGALLSSIEAGKEDGGPQAQAPIGSLADKRIAKVYRRMLKLGRRIDDRSPPEALHDLRKKGKELRYLLEFFASLYPKGVTKPMVRTLKALQDTLGRFHDRHVQADLIHSLGNEVEEQGGAEALAAMGGFAGRLEKEQAQARADFAKRFGKFASRRRRGLVRKTFG